MSYEIKVSSGCLAMKMFSRKTKSNKNSGFKAAGQVSHG